MDSPKQFFQQTFSISQHILELGTHSSTKTVKSEGFMKNVAKYGSNYSTLLTTWFDFAYYFCISPFRFVKEFPESELVIARNKFQNAICAIGHISTLMIYLGEVRRNSPSGPNPVKYLDFFMVHATLVRHFSLVCIFWRKSTLFKEIVNVLNDRCPMSRKYYWRMCGATKNKENIPNKWLAILIVSVYLLYVICIIVIQPLISISESHSTKMKEFENLENIVKFIYFVPLDKNYSHSEPQNRPVLWSPQGDSSFLTGPTGNIINTEYNVLPRKEEHNVILENVNSNISSRLSLKRHVPAGTPKRSSYAPNYFLVIPSFLGTVMRFLFGCLADCLILLIVLSLWFPAKDFANFIRMLRTNRDIYPFSTLNSLAEYRHLKKLSILINSSMKHLLIFVVLQAIFFYPVGVKQVVASCDYTESHYIGFFLGSFCLTFYFAADICKEMQSFPAYLRDEGTRWESSKLDLYMILQETTTNPVGIGDEGRFVIDYPFVATITGTLMTYFVVSIQYDQCPPPI